MKRKLSHGKPAERGIAMLMAVFALMLLASIGLAMLYAADTETSIDSNFRDQQTATYAALAGLQEGRERIRNVTGDIAWPDDLPTSSGSDSKVIYIVNPRAGESVRPWDPDNRYFDWELCRENLPSLCSGGLQPTNKNRYTVIDNSDSTQAGVWKRGVPLSYKWIRINLKSDNMIPGVPIKASGTNGTQVCYDSIGRGQIQKPGGYEKDCSPTGSIGSIILPPGAVGYTGPVTVTIAAPPSGGTTAQADGVLQPQGTGKLTNLRLTNHGSGYTSNPVVQFVGGGGGTGGTATAQIVDPNSHTLASVSLSSAGSPNAGCYPNGVVPTVVIGGNGSGATATATMSGSTCIAGITVIGSCKSSAGSTVTIGASGGGGSGFAADVTFAPKKGGYAVTSAVITNPGSGYSSVPSGMTGMSGGCTPSISWILGSKIASVSGGGGSGYTTAPPVTFSPAPSSGNTPIGTATLGALSSDAGQIKTLTLTNAGDGYSGAVIVNLVGGDGTGGSALVDVNPGSTNNELTGFNITNFGKGYKTAPTVTISGPGGPTLTTTAPLASTTYYGQVAVITAYAETPVFGNRRGAQSMLQMEVATPNRYPFDFRIGGALTMVGPTAGFGTPNSNNFYVNGKDANSCGETATAKPSIGVYDPDNQSAVTDLINDLARPDHYPGLQPSPDVESVANNQEFGTPTPAGLDAFLSDVQSKTAAPNIYTSSTPTSPTTFSSLTNMGSASAPVTNFVDGNLSLSGNFSGYGILVVTGNLVFSGDYQWHGLILVIGQGSATFAGGGNAEIDGSVYVAKTRNAPPNNNTLLPSLGTPTIDYSGGGGNGVHYDHCYTENLLGSLAQTPPPPDKSPLTILSQRTVTR